PHPASAASLRRRAPLPHSPQKPTPHFAPGSLVFTSRFLQIAVACFKVTNTHARDLYYLCSNVSEWLIGLYRIPNLINFFLQNGVKFVAAPLVQSMVFVSAQKSQNNPL